MYLSQSVYFSWPGEDVPIDLKADWRRGWYSGTSFVCGSQIWPRRLCNCLRMGMLSHHRWHWVSPRGQCWPSLHWYSALWWHSTCVHTHSRKDFTYFWLPSMDQTVLQRSHAHDEPLGTVPFLYLEGKYTVLTDYQVTFLYLLRVILVSSKYLNGEILFELLMEFRVKYFRKQFPFSRAPLHSQRIPRR